jgi:hypothetical protein
MAEHTRNSMKQKLAAGGYDALYVDVEHRAYSIETTSTICAAALGIGTTSLVRVPSHESPLVEPVLDGGAFCDRRHRCQLRARRSTAGHHRAARDPAQVIRDWVIC